MSDRMPTILFVDLVTNGILTLSRFAKLDTT